MEYKEFVPADPKPFIDKFKEVYSALKNESAEKAESYIEDMLNDVELHLENEVIAEDLSKFDKKGLENIHEELLALSSQKETLA